VSDPKRVLRTLLLGLASALWISAAGAQVSDNRAQPIGDPLVEARVQRLGNDLRCLTCMGQSIADSHSGFAVDMRREIREMIVAGKSDAQIMDFMVQRYGDFVLYKPPVKYTTWLLWGGPFVLLVLAVFALIRKLKRRAKEMVVVPLNESEHEAAARLLGTHKEN
jgi:cytochrome c-type biogenesis protein CcmH